MNTRSISLCLAAFLTLTGSFGCSTEPTPSGNKGNANTVAGNAAAVARPECADSGILNDMILARIRSTHGTKYPFINTRTAPEAIYLQGWTNDVSEFKEVESAIREVLHDNGCPNMRFDECHFSRLGSSERPYLRPSGSTCTDPYTPCGSICLPPPEVCDGMRP